MIIMMDSECQIQRAEPVEMRCDHDRDASRLLPEAAPEQHAALRLHAHRNRRAECLRSFCFVCRQI